jgi:uncharacterized protein (TIGR02246 family)
MTIGTKALCVALTGLAALAIVPAASQAADDGAKLRAMQQQKQVEQVIEKYIRGINQSSTDALIPLFTKDGVVMAPDAPTVEGADQLKASLDYFFSTIKLNARIFIDEIVVSGDYAYVRAHSEVKVTVVHTNDTHPEENRELFLMRKDAGTWKIARYMFNKKPVAK